VSAPPFLARPWCHLDPVVWDRVEVKQGKPECIEINGLEDAVKLAVCSCIKFDSQK
jgi:hypothetical protein